MGNTVNIRMVEKRDTAEILDIYKPYILGSHTTFETEVPSQATMWKRINKNIETLPWLVCIIHDKIAGYVYATDHRSRSAYRWTKELSLYVHEDYRKLHVGTGLYASMLEILRLQGVADCLAGIALPNEASVAFHVRHDFNKVGVYHKVGFKFGAWHNVEWWEFFLQDDTWIPERIIPVREIMNTPEYSDAIKKGISKIDKSNDS